MIDFKKICGIVKVVIKMFEIERHEIILKKLEEKGRLSYEEIEEFLNVSIATIRRDINKLEGRDLLSKVSGGIVAKRKINFEPEINIKFEENVEAKKKIAKRAAKLVKKGDFIFLDAGSTTYYMIEYLKNKNDRGDDDFELVVFDLYDIIIDFLEKKNFMEKCYDFEKKRGIERIVKAVTNSMKVNDDDSLIVQYIKENTPENAIVFLTGIGNRSSSKSRHISFIFPFRFTLVI